MSRYMLIMRGTDESNAVMMADIEQMITATRQFIDDMVKAGVHGCTPEDGAASG